MKVNMGTVDRAARIVLGLLALFVALGTGWIAAAWLNWVLIVVGLVLIVTALVARCPAYSIFGIRTCRM